MLPFIPVHYDVIILGAGAAGLMCAIEAGKRGRRVLVADHAKKPAGKIRISGGGRCNFTNIYCSPNHFLSQNPHFCVSALKRYRPQDFIHLVEKHRIAYHEKTLGQLFCDGSAQQIIDLLLQECSEARVDIVLETKADAIAMRGNGGFSLMLNGIAHQCESLVIATGGPSIPKMGSSGFGYAVAEQFGLRIISPRAALVPFTLNPKMLERYSPLSGVSVKQTVVTCAEQRFTEALLFTHRGLSGPAILQISSYWREGESITINLAPHMDVFEWIKTAKDEHPKQELQTALSQIIPKQLAQLFLQEKNYGGNLADLSYQKIKEIADMLHHWHIFPSGTEGFRTAEVTLGGVDTHEISSKTFEAKRAPGLYFIGEVLDVTGHLGGFNFQWAWSSGFAAGQYV